MFVSSKAGHDKGAVYVIIREEKEYVYVADGDARPLSHPKKKNWKHIQLIKKHQDAGLCEDLLAGAAVADERIKRAIKQYLRGQ